METADKQRAVSLARKIGLLPLFEYAKFLKSAAAARRENRDYLRDHPDFAPPPLWWMHDMYSHASYALYMRTGAETAAAIANRIDAHVDNARPRVADWGCGLARVLRHLPARFERTGFDYNRKAIGWCAKHFGDAAFLACGVAPPLPVETAAFDALYALSVFTHLSAKGHDAWIGEISRVLAPGGLLIATFHSAPGADQLLPGERARFDAGELIVRGGTKEGGRIYTAYQPESYLRDRLFAGFEILEGQTPFLGQTLFVARRS